MLIKVSDMFQSFIPDVDSNEVENLKIEKQRSERDLQSSWRVVAEIKVNNKIIINYKK